MKILAAFFSMFVLLITDLSDVRKMYLGAPKSEKAAADFFETMQQSSSSNITMKAYKGAAFTLKSKFASKLPEKISFFKEGAKLVDGAVATEPDNVEIRLIRLSIQESVPAIVNYKKNKKEDKAFILSHYAELSGTIKEYVKNFILQSKSFSAQDRQAVR